MRLVRWEPFGRDFSSLINRFNRSLDTRLWDEDDRESLGFWHPPVDIRENDNEIVLKAELPGMKKEDMSVHVENNVLTLRGERKREKEEEKDGFYRSERAYGSFCRSFTLPASVDAGKVGAAYNDGILTITLPKQEEAKPRQIEVKVA